MLGKIGSERIAIGDASLRCSLDTAHDDAFQMQVLQALALVDAKGYKSGVGTGMDQSRSAGKRLAIGILVLKAPSVGNKTRKQAVCHIGINRIAGKDQEIIDDDRAGSSLRTTHYNVAEFRAGGMMVDRDHILRAHRNRSRITQTLNRRNIHRDEQVGIERIGRRRGHVGRSRQEAINARNRRLGG